MAWIGMDTAQVRQISTELANFESKIRTLISNIDSEVTTIGNNWHGHDSTQFKSAWDTTHKTELEKARQLVHAMKIKLDGELKEQTRTSQAL